MTDGMACEQFWNWVQNADRCRFYPRNLQIASAFILKRIFAEDDELGRAA